MEHEVVAVLVGRGGFADLGRLVEVLHVFADDGALEEELGEFFEAAAEHEAVEEGVVVEESYDLL